MNGDAGSGAGLLADRERSSLAHSIRSLIKVLVLEAEESRLYVEEFNPLSGVLPRR